MMSSSGTHVQSIPPEILSRIFLQCLSRNCFPPPAKSEPPLLLGRVCSYWRSVALSTRELWTGIGLGARYRDAIDLTKDAMSVEQWRIRAGSSSGLSYNFCYGHGGGNINHGTWIDLMNSMIPQRQLWRRIQGLLPTSIAEQILSVISTQEAPMLEYLNIDIGDRYEHFIDLPSMPRLQKLVLRMKEPVVEFGACGSQSLREVVIQRGCNTLSLGVCWHFIALCPNLEVFQAHCRHRDRYHSYTAADIHRHTRLAYLHLHGLSENPGHFLDKIEAPYLKSMLLQCYYTRVDGVEQGWPHLSSFLNRSKCQLTNLVLRVHRMSEGDFVNCFRASPGLKSLCVEKFPPTTNALIAALQLDSLSSGEDILCPELEALYLYCMHCSPTALEGMIVSRCTNTTRKLRTVFLYSYDIAAYEQLLDAPRIVRCMEKGLQLVNGPSNSYERQCRTDDPMTVGWTE